MVVVVVHAAHSFVAEDGFLFAYGCGECWVLPDLRRGSEVIGHGGGVMFGGTGRDLKFGEYGNVESEERV